MAQYLSQITRHVNEYEVAIGLTSLSALVLLVMLVISVVAAYIERKEIAARLGDAKRLLKSSTATGPPATGRREGMSQRHPLQSYGSAVVPATPNDPWRRAHSRLDTATNLREAASEVLDINAEIKTARSKAHMLGVIYANEKAKARTAIMRKELGVFILLAIVGAIAAFGLK
jgi:hypothetical protein